MWSEPSCSAPCWYFSTLQLQMYNVKGKCQWATWMSGCVCVGGDHVFLQETHIFRGSLEHIHPPTHSGVWAAVCVPGSSTWALGVPTHSPACFKWFWVKGALDRTLGREWHRKVILEVTCAPTQAGGGLSPDSDCWQMAGLMGYPDLLYNCPCQIIQACSDNRHCT